MYCPFECIYVCFSLRSDNFFLCTIFVADWMIQSWFNVSSLSCSILGISMEPLFFPAKDDHENHRSATKLRVFKNPRMVRKKLSHRIAHTVGRGLPPFKYASWRETGQFDAGGSPGKIIPTVDDHQKSHSQPPEMYEKPECNGIKYLPTNWCRISAINSMTLWQRVTF